MPGVRSNSFPWVGSITPRLCHNDGDDRHKVVTRRVLPGRHPVAMHEIRDDHRNVAVIVADLPPSAVAVLVAVHATQTNATLRGGEMTALDHRMVIAIDGPAAAGKTTVARVLADRLNILLFDTGALYRAITLAALRQKLNMSDDKALQDLAISSQIDLRAPSVQDGRSADVVLNGEDVTWEIRSPEVDAKVSQVAACPNVRNALLEIQRRIADGARVVMVGRDIGTVVTPHAGTKIYLNATAEERARRRFQELRKRAVDIDYLTVLNELRERDYKDSSRATAPLRAADDALHIDTDGLDVDDIVSQIERIARDRWGLAA